MTKMVHFNEISLTRFLQEYWQKRPLVIRNALPNFINPLTPDELAGLALEEEIESRIVFETPQNAPYWQLKRGPFVEKDFTQLPATHWTLLVQGVDRFIPEVNSMLHDFNFIPHWRIDDVMISFAVKEGSVGPHYDNYDVFLYQAKGRRQWSLTTKQCEKANYIENIDLRIMRQFEIEEEYMLEEGDMLYLPPHVGHYGIAKSDECMTYSFGYRSYQQQELLDSFTEYLAEKEQKSPVLYRDPDWSNLSSSAEIPEQAWLNAKEILENVLNNDIQLKSWFGCFATQLDQQAETLLPLPLDDEYANLAIFRQKLKLNKGLLRNPVCRFAFQTETAQTGLALFMNGCEWGVTELSTDLVKLIATSTFLSCKELKPFLVKQKDELFLFELWSLQWLDFVE